MISSFNAPCLKLPKSCIKTPFNVSFTSKNLLGRSTSCYTFLIATSAPRTLSFGTTFGVIQLPIDSPIVAQKLLLTILEAYISVCRTPNCTILFFSSKVKHVLYHPSKVQLKTPSNSRYMILQVCKSPQFLTQK